MWQHIKGGWSAFHDSFHGSETILWSRFQILIASVWLSLQGVDLTPLVKDPKVLLYWIIFSNFVNEMARRNREDWGKPPC